jgi:hypothetical protein
MNTLLDSYNSNTLWEMAREARLPDTTGKKLKKDELLRVMRQHYFQPERIQKAYRQLTKLEHAVVDRLLLHEGQLSTRLFKRDLIRAELVTEAPRQRSAQRALYLAAVPGVDGVRPFRQPHRPTAKPRTRPSLKTSWPAWPSTAWFSAKPRPTTAAAQRTNFSYHPGDTLIIPSFCAPAFARTRASGPIIIKTWQPDFVMHGDPQLMLRDLYLYWDTVRRSAIALIQSGYVGKRGLKQLNDALLTPDPTLDKARQEDQASSPLPAAPNTCKSGGW